MMDLWAVHYNFCRLHKTLRRDASNGGGVIGYATGLRLDSVVD